MHAARTQFNLQDRDAKFSETLETYQSARRLVPDHRNLEVLSQFAETVTTSLKLFVLTAYGVRYQWTGFGCVVCIEYPRRFITVDSPPSLSGYGERERERERERQRQRGGKRYLEE